MSDKDEKYDLVLNTTILETEVGLMFTVSDEGGGGMFYFNCLYEDVKNIIKRSKNTDNVGLCVCHNKT